MKIGEKNLEKWMKSEIKLGKKLKDWRKQKISQVKIKENLRGKSGEKKFEENSKNNQRKFWER